MKIVQVDLNKDFSDVIKEAVAVLKKSGTIVFPTDAFYSLGANAMDEWAVERVFKIKDRAFSKPLPVFAKNMIWVKEMARVNKHSEAILEKVWPGKVTAILPKRSNILDVLTSGQPSIGIRISEHILVDKILSRFGYPLTATSAIITGQEPTNDIYRIIEIFSNRIKKPDLIIDVGILPKSDPSVIIDLTTDKPKVLRVGPSKPEQLMKLLEI